MIRSQAVLLAVAIGWDGRRSILGVELANRESRSSWRGFVLGLKERGLHGVEFVVADDHAGLRAALGEVLLCSFLEERARSRAAQGRRRLPAGAALDL